jgi:hypothetical protein
MVDGDKHALAGPTSRVAVVQPAPVAFDTVRTLEKLTDPVAERSP